MRIRITYRDKLTLRCNSLKRRQTWYFFEKMVGVLDGQEYTDPALMRIRLNIVRLQPRQDLITLNELLQQLATEAAMLETADYTKSEEETKEKFDSDKKLVQSLFNVHVRVETESGAVFSQNRGTILQGPDMPQKVTAVEFNTGYQFRERANRDARNQAYVLLDFRSSASPGFNVQPDNETPNNSQIVMVGENANWVRAAYSKIEEFLEPKCRKGMWLHRSGTYDLFLMTIGVLFLAWTMTWAVPKVDQLFGGYSQIYIYSGYVFSFLLALRFFMFMFNYTRLIWPVMEYSENTATIVAHRFIWSTVLLGVIAGIIKDLLF